MTINQTRKLIVSVVFTAGACLLALSGIAQPPPSASAAAASTPPAHDVVLPVTVRDKHGALVTTVQPSELTLTDEGRPQTIKSLTHDTAAPLRVGLLVDTSRGLSGALDSERKAAESFVDLILPTPPAKKDQAFLIHFDREVELLQDFTDSRDKLHHELDEMGPTRQSQNDSQGPETTGDDREPRSRGSRSGTQLYDAIFLASDELMSSKDGRKALIVFSDGIDRGSKDRLPEAIDAADKANVEIYTIYFKGEQERGESSGFPGGGNRRGGGGWPGGGGGGYPGGGGGYPGGGGRRGGNNPTVEGVDGRKIMQQIAARTGGHAYEAKKKDDIAQIYSLINDELRAQFQLTYTPDKLDLDGTFHKVVLKANKDDLTVVTREGYFAPESSK